MDNGLKQAWQTFKETRRNSPAYREFLSRFGYKKPKGPLNLQIAFSQIPIADKNNYIRAFDIFRLIPPNRSAAQICASSGSSGAPTFWARDRLQEAAGGKIHELIFKKIFKIDSSQETLVVICFAMGVWVAGGFTLASCRWLNEQRGFRLISITPGIDKADILAILKNLAPKFKQVILVGYPPFLLDVVKEAKQQKLRFQKKTYILASGEKLSERWRGAMFSLLGKHPDWKSIINIYGSADVGAMAYETPFTTALRQNAATQPTLYHELFGEEFVVPGLYQYDPLNIYFEAVNGELILTTNTAVPLVRYNIHDKGRVIWPSTMREILRRNKGKTRSLQTLLSKWNLPLLVVKNRTDVALTFYSLNIYPENILTGLEDKKLNKLVTGKFFAFTSAASGEEFSESLNVNVELAAGIKPATKLASLIADRLTNALEKHNLEFRKLRASLGNAAVPKIRLQLFGASAITPQQSLGLAYQKGKKAKLILPAH